MGELSSDNNNMQSNNTKVVENNLRGWEQIGEECKAPLTETQLQGVLKLTAYASTRPFPTGLPLDDGPIVVLPPAVKTETPENLPEHFVSLQSRELTIENAQQFFTWYAKVEEEMVAAEDSEHRLFICEMEKSFAQCEQLLDDTLMTLSQLDALHKQYLFVSNKTNSLHEACEQLLHDQTKLMTYVESISNKLSYFNELDKISQRLHSQTLSVLSESFVPMLTRLDECIGYMIQNPQIKEHSTYLAHFRHLLAKALGMVKSHVVASLEHATQQVVPKNDVEKSGDNAFTLFYGKFRTNAHKVKSLMEQIEERVDKNSDYQQLMSDCHQCYLQQRELLMQPSVSVTINELYANHERDHCALVRSGCAFLLHVCEDEHQLFFQFFTKQSPQLNEFLEGLCNILYDVLRPLIIHIPHLETLAELCSILKIEMIDEHIRNSPESLAAFESVAVQMLQDVQERLVYRTHIYIRTDILSYNPAPGDLAYPEKLEMMESIAESLMQQGSMSRSESRSSIVSLGSTTSQEVANINASALEQAGSEVSSVRSRFVVASPADLHGMWYPTVRRTLVCLSKLYRCLDRSIFQGLSQDALAMCTQSLSNASQAISKNKTALDGQLFEIKHLLILREQIAPFQVEFSIKETSIDFSKVRYAARALLQKKSQLFALNSTNSLLEFLLQGTPQVTEHFVDSKKDVDNHLKFVCEEFIAHVSDLLVRPLKIFLEQASVITKLKEEEGGRHVALQNQPFASAEKVSALVNESNRAMKTHVLDVQQKMVLYLANRETEAILFRPVRANVQNTYSQMLQVIKANYTEEDQLIIACLSVEQINIMFATSLIK